MTESPRDVSPTDQSSSLYTAGQESKGVFKEGGRKVTPQTTSAYTQSPPTTKLYEGGHKPIQQDHKVDPNPFIGLLGELVYNVFEAIKFILVELTNPKLEKGLLSNKPSHELYSTFFKNRKAIMSDFNRFSEFAEAVKRKHLESPKDQICIKLQEEILEAANREMLIAFQEHRETSPEYAEATLHSLALAGSFSPDENRSAAQLAEIIRSQQ